MNPEHENFISNQIQEGIQKGLQRILFFYLKTQLTKKWVDTRHQRNNSKGFSGPSELAYIFKTPFTKCLYAKSSAAEFLSRFLKLFGRFLKTTPQLSLPTTLPSFATSYHSNLAFDIIAFIGALKNVLEGHRIPIEV